MLPGWFRPNTYTVAITFYDTRHQVFRQVFAPGSYDLTYVKGAYPVIVRAAMDENGNPDIEIEFTTRF
jgi:hypothetical protein